MSVSTIAIRLRVWSVLPFWSIQTPPKRQNDEKPAALPRLILSEKGTFLTRKELFLTVREGADLTPENENEIGREQEKFRLDGVAILTGPTTRSPEGTRRSYFEKRFVRSKQRQRKPI